MEARNRALADWFTRLRTGQIKLPRFQRFEAWGHNEIASLLEAVLRELPAGATLVLEVGATEPFISRFVETAAAPNPERVTEHLLDGQQRLTALWRALHDNYVDRTYLLRWDTDEDHDGDKAPVVVAQARWWRNGTRYPVWCDRPTEMLSRGFVPVGLLRPGANDAIRRWCDAATENDLARSRDLELELSRTASTVANYNIPYLSLPSTTPKDIALDVFIKMNTSSVHLSAFDIVVAQFEEAVGQSMHDLVSELHAAVPAIGRYRDPGNLVLDVAAMRSGRTPSQASYQRLDLRQVAEEWEEIVEGLRWMVECLEDEHVYDGDRLPTVAVLPVLAAMHDKVPPSLDSRGNAKALARAYLWRAFLTRRYESSAGSRSLQDLRGLLDALERGWTLAKVESPIFDEESFPIAGAQELMAAGWPRSREILARGILATSLRMGGRDLADGTPARADNIARREYHHLFPDSLLTTIAALATDRSFAALNCVAITWSTNRNISNKSPLQYLTDRIDKAHLGEGEIRSRLASHLVPFKQLKEAGPYGAASSEKLLKDYQSFLQARADMMLPIMRQLCDGMNPTFIADDAGWAR